ncbi:MAG: nickel-dependent lactate racemase family protein [Candidatus Hermodarchaeia archaeon]|jgi:nickel-dependent lactate racemase
MTKVNLLYGSSKVPLEIPDRNLLGILDAKPVEGVSNPDKTVLEAILNPIASKQLTDIAQSNQTAAIVVDDHTRGLPCHILINPMIDQLQKAGVKEKDITIIFGTGTHRATTPEEQQQLLCDVSCKDHRVEVHNCDAKDLVHVGKTSYGTEVEVNRLFHDADLHLLTGDIGYHYYSGFGGGRKSVLPAVASRRSINANHGMLTHPKAFSGNLDGNPIHLDMVEAAKLARTDFIVNFVRNTHKEIVSAFAGDLEQAFHEGVKLVDELGRVRIKEKADIVITSSGYPKDINLYQGTKAMVHALGAVREGGVLIALLECREGIGHKVFEEWAHKYRSFDELSHQVQTNFIMGGHKIFYMAQGAKQVHQYLISELDADEAKEYYYVTPFKSAEKALKAAFDQVGRDATVYVMPHGPDILPTTA